MIKRNFRLISLCVAIFGTLLICAALISYGIAAYEFIASRQENGTGIIGGMDRYTLSMIRRSLNEAIPVSFLFGVAIFLSGIFSLIFAGTVQKSCTFKTSIVSLGLSASISLGVYGLFSLMLCSFDSTPARHPIRHPASIMICAIALGAAAILFVEYCHQRLEKTSFKGILIDIGFSILYLIPFFSLYGVLDQFLKSVLI